MNDLSDETATTPGLDFAAGMPSGSLQEGVPLLGHVGDDRVILLRQGTDVLTVGAACTHYGGSLVGTREKTSAAHASTRRSETPSAVAIIGGGAARNRAAAELRRLGFQGAITVFHGDESARYDRPNLSEDYLTGNAPEAWLLQLSHSRSGAGTWRLVRISCHDRCPEDVDARGEGIRTR